MGTVEAGGEEEQVEGVNGADAGGGADNVGITQMCSCRHHQGHGQMFVGICGEEGGAGVLSGKHANHLWETCLSPACPRINAS